MTGGEDELADVGWLEPFWRGALGVVPFVGRHLLAGFDDSTASVLMRLRAMLVTFCVAMVLVGLTLVPLLSGNSSEGAAVAPGLLALLVTAAGLCCLLAVTAIKRRYVKCASDEQLVGAYTSRFFSGLAFSEIPALLGFVGTLLSQSATPVIIGMGFAACGFALIAPTRSEIERTQEILGSQGCRRSLSQALTNSPKLS